MILYISVITIFIFAIQNINMYPYQYTWFNIFSNFTDINKNFEIDYWGVSGRNIAKKINSNDKLLSNKDNCIYASPKHVIEPFIDSKYKCIKNYLSIYPKSSEKYILVKYMRNIRRENPDDCKLIFEENYNLNVFSNNGEAIIINKENTKGIHIRGYLEKDFEKLELTNSENFQGSKFLLRDNISIGKELSFNLNVDIGDGASCHVGYRSCFYRSVPLGPIDNGRKIEMKFLEKEKKFDPEKVYKDQPNPTKI